MKPSTRASSTALTPLVLAFAFTLVLALGVFACARSTGTGVVEAPMMSADASASAIALMNEPGGHADVPAAPTTEVPFKVGDRMTGFYTCNQGKTAMVLVFEEILPVDEETAEVIALFEFHYDGNRPGYAKADGSARVRGKYEVKGRRLRLKGEEWIVEPPNYSLITLVGVVSKSGGYAGTVEGQGCTSFSAVPERSRP